MTNPGDIQASRVVDVFAKVGPWASDGVVTQVDPSSSWTYMTALGYGTPHEGITEQVFGPSSWPTGISVAADAQGLICAAPYDGIYAFGAEAAFQVNSQYETYLMRIARYASDGNTMLEIVASREHLFIGDAKNYVRLQCSGICELSASQQLVPKWWGSNYSAGNRSMKGDSDNFAAGSFWMAQIA